MLRELTWIGALALLGCDRESASALDAGGATVATPASTAAQAAPPPAQDAGPSPPARVMPPRPVPTTSPTVTINMPVEVQLAAIQYMAAMQAPQPGDAPADPDYARGIADGLRGAGRPDVISSGRVLDIKLDKGCDATRPRQLIARSSGAGLGVLLAHGVLVVRCSDRQVQCLQSTRDGDDVLCTHK